MNVLSFGEILWDIFDTSKRLGGAPLNFASYISWLGENSWILSGVGEDELGRECIKEIEELGLETGYISTVSDKETGKCVVTLDSEKHPAYELVDGVAYDFIPVQDIKEQIDVCSFGTLALRNENNKEVIQKILSANSFENVFCDLNIRPPFYSKESILICLENATIVKISDEELPLISKEVFKEIYDVETFIFKLAEMFCQIKVIVITMGEKGSTCYDCKEQQFYRCEAHKTDVVSTVGAGDSFGAAFLVKYMRNYGFMECLEFASEISAIVCSKQGAISNEIRDLVKNII